MKKIIILLLGLCSIYGFGQSDLEIQPSYVANGLTSTPNYRHNNVRWSFNALNIGTTEANVVPFTIYLSRDNDLDANDLVVHTGNLGDDNLNSPSSGLNANASVQIPSYLVTEEDFYFPWNYEANEEYFFIFEIDQDVAGGEVNNSNNVAVLPFYLTLDDKLKVQHVDYTVELGNKTPLLLVHGWQPEGYNAEGNTNIWDNFLTYFNNDSDLTQNFKPYYVKYNSNIVPVNDLGHELRLDLDNWFGTDYTGNISIVAHSMGGLVSRSFMNGNRDVGPHAGNQGGDRVNKLITLGTPHHGSPMANGEIRLQANINTSVLIPLVLLNAFDNSFYALSVGGTKHNEYNRFDLRWDNFDGLWSQGVYSSFTDEHNDWLNSDRMNLNTVFDNKIIAYSGYFTGFPPIELSNNYYHGHNIQLTSFAYQNDGIVPNISALYYGHNINKRRQFIEYYHDEIAKGLNNTIDYNLFGAIKSDLLDNQISSIIDTVFLNYEYPNTAIGNNSSKEIIVSNTGDLDLTISSIQLIGVDNAQFNFNFPTVPFTIPSNNTEAFTVDFMPTSIGDKTVTFRVNNSSANNPVLDIQLNGLAVQTATTDYNTNTESLYDFGDVYIYGGSNLVTLNVSNSSSAPYTVAGLNITGVNANLFTIVQEPIFPKLFNPGDSDIVVLSFDPDTVGEKTAVIEASFQDNTILDTANLVGNGVNTVINPNASKLTNYEYWYNNDYASKQNVSLTANNSNESLSFLANPLNTNNGLNIFHFRTKDSDGSWSSVSSDYVHIQNATNGTSNNQMISYEYWFDEDYDNKIAANTNANNLITLNIDALTTNVNTGLHRFNIRFLDNKNQWSSILTESVLIHNDFGENDTNKILSYEYWFDEDYTNKVSGNINAEGFVIFNSDLSTNSLSKGLHKLNIRFKDSKQSWSSIQTDFILKTNEPNLGFNTITKYRYWFNQDFTNMSSIDISPMETFVLMDNIDMSSFTTDTFNYIHFQFKDIYGNWSSVLTEEVFLCGVIAQPIISADSNLLSTETATAYQWYLYGDLIDGATNQFYEATEQGDYTVEITNSNGCKSISDVFIYSTLNVTDEELSAIKVFPNPTDNEIFIISKTTDGKLDLYNSLGQLILSYDNIPKNINLSNLETAIYFIKIQVENNKTQTFKIIKK